MNSSPLARSIGLPAKEAKSTLELRSFKEAVDSDWFRSRSLESRRSPLSWLIIRQWWVSTLREPRTISKGVWRESKRIIQRVSRIRVKELALQLVNVIH